MLEKPPVRVGIRSRKDKTWPTIRHSRETPIGQWTEWGLTVGWHEYVDRRGNVRKYYKNNLSQMPSGYEDDARRRERA